MSVYMLEKYLWLWLVVMVLCGCSGYEPDASDLALRSWDIPVSLASSSGVVYADSLYLFFGRDGNSSRSSQQFRYVIPLDNPTEYQRLKNPLSPRVNATAVVVDDKLYCGLGFCGAVYSDGSLLQDWWCFDFATQEFTRKADFIGSDADAAVSWTDGSDIYVAMGFATGFMRNLYRYSTKTDSWTLVSANVIEKARALPVGAMADGRFFVGGGYCTYMLDDWYEYETGLCRFVSRTPMPIKGCVNASAVGVEGNVYVLGGRYFGGTLTTQYFYRCILVYNAVSDSWSVLGNMETAAENMVAFHHDGCLYWGFGQREDGSFVNKLYMYKL